MGFSSADKREVERILSNLTGTMDALGKAKRDVSLILKVHQDWPETVRAGLMAYFDLFQGALIAGDSLESHVLRSAELAVPPPAEERPPG